ncbi:MAG: hypothetical protein J6K52_06170 [Clostridia bacterium]|nr:hypothetical protein [Clostridia bacterium]
MFECTYNENGILKTVKYKDSYVKNTLQKVLLLYFLMLIIVLTSLILYFKINISIYISISCSVLFILGGYGLWMMYSSQKRFSLTFDEEQIHIKNCKKIFTISYSSIKTYGFLHRVGSLRLSSIMIMNTRTAEEDSKSQSTVFFSINKNDDFCELTRKINRSVATNHGIYKKSIFYISDYIASPVLGQCVKAIKYYTQKYSPEVINMDRKELRNKDKKG